MRTRNEMDAQYTKKYAQRTVYTVLVFSTDGNWKLCTRSLALWARTRDSGSYMVDVQLTFF